jgi:hypothetical protein
MPLSLPERIAERIRSTVASTSPFGGHIDNEAAKYGGIALMGSIGAVWLLRSDGTLWEVDDDFGRPLTPLAAEWYQAALLYGAKRHPWLVELIPPPPAGALTCPTCKGGSWIPCAGCTDPNGLICPECRGRGWHPAS